MGRAAFDDDSGGCEPLLSNWGGEGIYWALADEPGAPSPGIPTIVVTQIQVNVPLDTLHVFPGGLAQLLVGLILGTDGQHADVILKAPVPPEDIIDIWQPGDSEYDRHAAMPQR